MQSVHVWLLGFDFAQQEVKGMSGHTCRMPVAGEAPGEELAQRVVAVREGRPRESKREREGVVGTERRSEVRVARFGTTRRGQKNGR